MTTKDLDQRNDYLKENYPEMYVGMNFHHTHKNEMLSFDGMRYLRNIYMDKSDYIVFRKCTQVGISEYLVVRAITASANGRGVFYVMPTQELIRRFVKNRVDRSIEFTPFYRNLLKYNPSRSAENISLKHIGKGSIAFLGSNASAGFTEYPADDLIIDEMDECDQEKLAMAVERLSASKNKRIIKIGNPTFLGIGIDAEYNKSNQQVWEVKCPHCGLWQTLDFFKNIVKEVEAREYVIIDKGWEKGCGRDIYVLCIKCKKPVDRHADGRWVKKNPRSDISGYQVNKIFAKHIKITELIDRFEEGLVDDTKLQRFYNGDLGLAFTASGAKVDYSMLQECMGDYSFQTGCKNPCVMGIDVGNKLHTVIGEMIPGGKIKTIYAGMLKDPEDILDLARRFKIRFGIIDALPEKRMSKKLAGKIRGLFLCYYGDVKKIQSNIQERFITVDRTASLDAVKEAVLTKGILFPRNADKMMPLASDGYSELFYEMTTATRILNERRKAYEWIEGGNPDHYFHAVCYMLLAHRLFVRAMNR